MRHHTENAQEFPEFLWRPRRLGADPRRHARRNQKRDCRFYSWLIFARNSPLVCAFAKRSMRSSIASTGDSGFSTLRNTQMRAKSSFGMSSSSFRVPERWMSIAGKVRLSTNFRSRMISQLPVPLNSSKITSSIREPVSIRRGGNDRQRTALLNIPRRAEEPLRTLQGV